ncbi:MAG: tail fiber domain-containing protein, partial [Prolixibacteraceae bacterium]|nr:tail fiber domain-containing protein [Prolixibacteraceae bacterium]
WERVFLLNDLKETFMKLTTIFLLGFLALTLNGFSQIKVNSTGKVGINNTSPSYQLDVSGDFRINDSGDAIIFNNSEFYPDGYISLGSYSDRWEELYAIQPTFTYSPDIDSDKSFKTDIRSFSDVSEKIGQLHAVKYKLKEQYAKGKEQAKEEGDLYGFIAQEVMDIFPDIVTTRENGTHGIRYTELIPVLVKGLQEQQKEIDALKERIEKLESSKK